MSDFNGKVAIVTGAASGIGRSIAQQYARAGAQVAVSDLAEEDGQETVRLVRDAGGEAVFVKADVSDPAACEALVQKTLDTYGRLDFACNNAGIGGESNPVGDMSVKGWEQVIAINLSAVFYGMKYEIPAMLKSGGGAIVNMGSILSQAGFPSSAGYVAAKHGVVGLTKTAALDYATQGIRVNAVGPGFIHTPLIAAMEEDKQANEMLVSKHPIGRLGKPEEVAELALFLSTDRASFMTGAYVPVDGGYLAP